MGLTVDSYLLLTSKSLDTKTRIKIKNPAPISFRYCALKNPWSFASPHYKWGRR